MRNLDVRMLLLCGLAFATACGDGGEGTFRASGHVNATEVQVAASVPGRIEEMPFSEGQRVTAGAVLARLDAEGARRELERAEAEIDSARARLELLQAGSRATDVRSAQAAAEQARVERDQAARDAERFVRLTDKGSATRKAAEDATTRLEVAQRALERAEAELEKVREGPRPQEVAQARAQLEAARRAASVLEERVAEATVVSPLTGIVTVRVLEPGEYALPGMPLLVLTDLERPWLEVYIDEPHLAHVAVGDEVEVRVDGREEAFTGRVRHIAESAEFTPKNVQTPDERAKLVFEVEIALDPVDGVFKPGLPADAIFRLPGGEAS